MSLAFADSLFVHCNAATVNLHAPQPISPKESNHIDSGSGSGSNSDDNGDLSMGDEPAVVLSNLAGYSFRVASPDCETLEWFDCSESFPSEASAERDELYVDAEFCEYDYDSDSAYDTTISCTSSDFASQKTHTANYLIYARERFRLDTSDYHYDRIVRFFAACHVSAIHNCTHLCSLHLQMDAYTQQFHSSYLGHERCARLSVYKILGLAPPLRNEMNHLAKSKSLSRNCRENGDTLRQAALQNARLGRVGAEMVTTFERKFVPSELVPRRDHWVRQASKLGVNCNKALLTRGRRERLKQ